MAHIENITIKRFKRLEDVTLPLSDSTVLVGANNAGKSSVLQAIHFAVAVAQSAKLFGTVTWMSNKYELSISPTQLLYTPVADAMTLASGGRLVEDQTRRVEITFRDSNGLTCTVAIKRGRNRNLGILIEGRELGERLQDIDRPFSVYAPGLAGVPKEEIYLSAGRIKRMVARGDANLVLRNVLLQLSRQEDAWNQFVQDMNELFPRLLLEVTFDEENDEHINATFQLGDGPTLPLDAAGTAILQASQILSYVSLFKPEILVLDEPDSHLHPNNQRALCGLIFKLSRTRGFQAVISTHSRHVLDAMRGRGNLIWLSQGGLVDNPDVEMTAMLLQLGALDSADYFADGQTKCVVATEDEDKDYVKEILWSSGFVEEDTEVISYAGCSKVEAAIVLGQFLRKKAPNIKMVVHKDRDYLSDGSIEKYRQSLARHDIHAFVTDYSDIEGYYLNAAHLSALNPELTGGRAAELIQQVVDACKDLSFSSIVTQRQQEANRRRAEGDGQFNPGDLAAEALRDYMANPAQMARGKVCLGRLRALIQQELGRNPTVIRSSEHLAVPELQQIAQALWQDARD
jgi:hypothetical protein